MMGNFKILAKALPLPMVEYIKEHKGGEQVQQSAARFVMGNFDGTAERYIHAQGTQLAIPLGKMPVTKSPYSDIYDLL